MKIHLLFLSAFTTISFSSKSQTSYVLHPFQDASVGYHQHEGSAFNNYGMADYYGSFSQPGVDGGVNAGMGLMEFDLSFLPVGTVIQSASLDLYGRGPFGGGEAASVGDTGINQCQLCRITEAWDQNIVTYATKPAYMFDNYVRLHASTSVDEDYLNIDVTALVQDMVNDPQNSHGFLIRLERDKPVRALAFWSTDGSDAAKWPTLTIAVDDGQRNSISKPLLSATLYPNPVSSFAIISLSEVPAAKNLQLQIVNEFGQTVKELIVPASPTITFSRDDLVNGIYFYQLKNEEHLIAQGKLIVD